MVVLTFAVPHESAPLRRRIGALRPVEGLADAWEAAGAVMLLHTGIGPETAAARLRALLARHRPRWVLSAGYAGGLDPALHTGDLILAGNLSSAPLLERARGVAAPPGCACHDAFLTTQQNPASSVEAKAALARATGAAAVDMESGALAQAAAASGVPFLAVRVISDAANEPLPVPLMAVYDLARQRPRPAAFAAYLALHPGRIVPFVRFLNGLGGARSHLAAWLADFLKAEGFPPRP